MSFQDQLGGVFKDMFSGTVGVAFWILVALIVGGLVFGIGYYFFIHRKKFDIKIQIRSLRANEPSVFFDKGAILNDKNTKTKYLRLAGLKIDLELPPFNIFEKTNEGDYVEILRVSEDGFRFLTAPKIDKKFYIRRDGKLYPFAGTKQRQIESDIYWILGRKQKNKSIISPESFLMQLLQYTPHLITLAIVFMMLWIILNQLPVVVDSIRMAAEAIRDAGTPVVVGS